MLGGILGGIAVVLALGALIYCQKLASLAARGAPKALVDGYKVVLDRLQAVETESGSVRALMSSWVADITGLMESVEGCLAQIETKRRRTTTAARRLDRENGGAEQLDPAHMTRENSTVAQLTQVARDRGVY